MSGSAGWAAGALFGSAVLMALVLAVRDPVRRLVGPGLGYALWALPAARLLLPPLPATLFAIPASDAGAGRLVLAMGPRGADFWRAGSALPWRAGSLLLAAWLIGGAMLFGAHLVRYARFRRRLLAGAREQGRRGAIRIVTAGVDGPLAFGVLRRFVATPRDFDTSYDPRERELAMAHEVAHHQRGDLIANWGALAVLSVHWWKPVAWAAHRAFREDQEFAVDAHVLSNRDPAARATYARVLAKASGLGTLAVCHLNHRSNLGRRLVMLTNQPLPKPRLILGGGALASAATAALAATVPVMGAAATPTSQAVTIGVKPDGTGRYELIVAGAAVAPGARLPGDATLPSDFTGAGGCDLNQAASPVAMVIKGSGATRTYTVMCASAKPASVDAMLEEGLASLRAMRASVAMQRTPAFPEAERSRALGAIDRSIREVERTLATS